MGGSLSKSEERELNTHLLGIDPTSLTTVIWDTINNVGVDDELEKFGISFEEGEPPRVIFWDNGEATEMPRKVFLELLDMMSGRITDAYEHDYDLDKSPELKAGVEKVKLAKHHLQKEIGSLEGQEGAKDYGHRLERVTSVDESTAEELVKEVRQRRGSMMWTNGESIDSNSSRRRMTTRGLGAVVDRLPELRQRYETATKTKSLSKVKNKILALGSFGTKINPDTVLKEEEVDFQLMGEGYNGARRDTLTVSYTKPKRTPSQNSVSTVGSSSPTLPGSVPSSVTTLSAPSTDNTEGYHAGPSSSVDV